MKRIFASLLVVLPLLFSMALVSSCSSSKIQTRSKGVVLQDNTVVHYLEAGQGPVLILIHGLGSSANVWCDDIGLLATDYRVIAVDLPGYGKSDRPKADYSVEYQAGMIKNFIEALGVDKVTLVGNSFGGWIAALVALDSPDRVSRLVLVDSAGLRREAAQTDVPPNPATREEEKTLLLALFADKSKVTESLVNEQWDYRKDIRATVQAAIESFKNKAPFLDNRLQNIKVPTLIIWGEQDMLVPLEVAERFTSGIRGSKLIVINNAGHQPQAEQPKAFTRAVKGFVKSW
jgi:pimeloyl-ACP methyl ester carboxylesterase